nr:hypothetical protein CFP56_35441 [Quercus suber]
MKEYMRLMRTVRISLETTRTSLLGTSPEQMSKRLNLMPTWMKRRSQMQRRITSVKGWWRSPSPKKKKLELELPGGKALIVKTYGRNVGYKKIAISDGQSSSQQHKKPSQISIADGKRPSTAVRKSLVGNTILPTRPLLTLIFDSTTPS